jgi:hypothetical protein
VAGPGPNVGYNHFSIKNKSITEIMGSGVFCVDLFHEDARYRFKLDIYETAAVFSTRVYLATGVIPARQCILGFQVILGFLAIGR